MRASFTRVRHWEGCVQALAVVHASNASLRQCCLMCASQLTCLSVFSKRTLSQLRESLTWPKLQVADPTLQLLGLRLIQVPVHDLQATKARQDTQHSVPEGRGVSRRNLSMCVPRTYLFGQRHRVPQALLDHLHDDVKQGGVGLSPWPLEEGLLRAHPSCTQSCSQASLDAPSDAAPWLHSGR